MKKENVIAPRYSYHCSRYSFQRTQTFGTICSRTGVLQDELDKARYCGIFATSGEPCFGSFRVSFGSLGCRIGVLHRKSLLLRKLEALRQLFNW